MKKLIYSMILLLIIALLYSCKINVSDDENEDEGPEITMTIDNPVPHDCDSGISVTPNLWWSCSNYNFSNLRYEIYLDTINPPCNFLDIVYCTSYYVTDSLSSNTTYYWKIKAVYDNGSCSSSIWRFTTTLEGW